MSTSMSSFSSPSPLTVPFKFRRKSSSSSTSASMENYNHSLGDVTPYSSPPSSHLPLLPLHLTRRNECTEWKAGDYFDDLHGVIFDQQDKVEYATHPWSCRTHPLPYLHRPFPSLMTKLAAHDAPLSYSPPTSSFVPKTTYFYPQGDNAIADDCEEYDLESMDIHIRETYFATSAERGRWLSSPIVPRVRSQAMPPMRGHSSPIKTLADASPPREHLCRHNTSCSVDQQISTSSSEDADEVVHCSSSLPPSSPLASPMSTLSLLSDYEGDSAVNPRSNSDDCHSLTGTPELSISSTTCTSPVEPTRTPTPYEVPATAPAHPPTAFACHPAGSIISRHTNSCSPKPTDVYIHALRATNFEPDRILSPLSQFELDLPEAEPSKQPLSDTVNKPYQHTANPSATVDAWSQDGPLSTQSLSLNLNHEPPEVSLDTVGESSSDKKAKKRRESATGNRGAKRTKKRTVFRSASPPSDAKKRRGAERSDHSEPPSKKSKLSRCRDDIEGCGAKSLSRRRGISKANRPSRSPPLPAAESCDSESAYLRDTKTLKLTARAQLRQPTPSPSTTPAPMDAVDVEFHASLTGMLIEALATSRATSMDASALYLVVTQAHPYLTAQRPKRELLLDIAAVLEAGHARCRMFEKVDGSGERSRHKALEDRWFYVPERDEDPERASLISAIMPRQKRSETKKYKQYYYRPLDKISRWDPEDAP